MHTVYPIKTRYIKWSNYCYLIIDLLTHEAAIVDPAWDLDLITKKLKNLNLTAILLTHSHFDHVHLVEPLVKRFNPIVYMSQIEIDTYGFQSQNLNPIEDGAQLKIGKTSLRALLTPGHTAGSMCYLSSDNLFSGDTIFTEGCGICIGQGASAEAMFATIQRIKSEVPRDVRIYPGHSYGKQPGQTLNSLFKENIYFQIENKEHFVNFRMRKNQKNFFDFA